LGELKAFRRALGGLGDLWGSWRPLGELETFGGAGDLWGSWRPLGEALVNVVSNRPPEFDLRLRLLLVTKQP